MWPYLRWDVVETTHQMHLPKHDLAEVTPREWPIVQIWIRNEHENGIHPTEHQNPHGRQLKIASDLGHHQQLLGYPYEQQISCKYHNCRWYPQQYWICISETGFMLALTFHFCCFLWQYLHKLLLRRYQLTWDKEKLWTKMWEADIKANEQLDRKIERFLKLF